MDDGRAMREAGGGGRNALAFRTAAVEANMIRTGEEYRAGLRDGRAVWIDGERVADVTVHPAFKPIVDAKARMYDMAHEPAYAPQMMFEEAGERFSTLLRPP